MERAERRALHRRMRLPLVAFAALTLLTLAGILLIRTALLRNARETGTALSASCAAEEEGRLSVYETLLNFGVASLDSRLAAGESREEIRDFVGMYFRRVDSVLGSGVVDPYVVLDGEILAANPWEWDAEYDYAAAPWYTQARSAEGRVIFTDVYTDAVYGRPVVTAAQSCAQDGAVMAFDILPEHLSFEAAELKEEESFFLCDGKGTAVYQKTALELPQEEVQAYLTSLVERISSGELEGGGAVRDMDGRRRAVYYTRMDNGWYSIVTVPYGVILGELWQVGWALLLMFAVSLLALFALARREQHLGERARRANETAQVLGNTYYALYRVNYERETYEMIKGSDYVRSRIPAFGPYGELLRTAGEVVEAEAFRDFTKSFSCENIRQLVDRQVSDYGGEFLRRFGDEYRWVSVRVLFDAALEAQEVVLCFREVEREKERQLQERRLLEDALQLAKQNEQSKQAFFRNMSHDMRTPLNAILGSSELARQHLDEPQRAAGYLDRIDSSGRYLLGLINDILEMARMEHGQVQLESRPFDLRKCVDDCLAAFRIQAGREGKALRENFAAGPETVVGDERRIQQILNNLLSNAFKFTPAGGEITLSVRQTESGEYGRYEFTVADTGIGMSPEFLRRIFEPYAREMRFGDRAASGTGLGMSITRSLAALMGGEIQVESEPGKGSRFTVVLPLPSAEPGQAGPAAEAAARAAARPDAGAFTLEGLSLLLAEDNEINMEITTEMLAARGVRVAQAFDGAEAVELFRQSAPFAFDAVLMDMQMPGLDGCAAARQIRALPRADAQSVPIIAVTANAFAEDVAATAAAGMDAHISKPIDFKKLAQALEQLLCAGEKGNKRPSGS